MVTSWGMLDLYLPKYGHKMRDLRLVRPTVELKDEYLEMLNEWKQTGEKFVPWVLHHDSSDFAVMIEKLNGYSHGIGIREGFVEHSTYWGVTESKRVIGAVNIRHRLNDFLRDRGGHIGYGVRPSDRRKGYATEMLHLALEIARGMGIDRALLVCGKDNIASAKTIIRNGGVLDSEGSDEGKVFQRYWINLAN